MLLKKLSISKLGPFSSPIEINLSPNVTILTGSNDVGKTSILRLLQSFLENKSATEWDINQDYLQSAQVKWTDDTAPEIKAEFRIDNPSEVPHRWDYSQGDTAMVSKSMVATNATMNFLVHSKKNGTNAWKVNLPKVTFHSNAQVLRDHIDLAKPNALEAALLHVGFGAPFDFARLDALSPINYSRQLRDAEIKINRQMMKVMPTSSAFRFHLQPIEGNRKSLAILLQDHHDAVTPFGLRGSGVRKMITLLAELITSNHDAHHRILLLDEPENSLHADAQHLLREFLFDLTKGGNVQVIYATHSPCMINPLRPEQVRLLRRRTQNAMATTYLERHPTESNFLALRTSLGVGASDSLLFAPVTVIVEGDTEFKCFAALMRKFVDSNLPGFEDALKLLSLTHFLDGMGDSYEFLCRLAKSQGTRVILFLDGDKRKSVEKQKMKEKHPDVPIVFLPGQDEFEEIIPSDIYFEALAQELGSLGKGNELQLKCNAWVDVDEKRKRKAFSKRVWGWLEDDFGDCEVTKPSVMRKAVEIADVSKINAQPFLELLSRIRTHLENTSF